MELPPPIRSLQIPLLYANNIIALGFKPGKSRILFTLPTTLLLLSQSLYRKEHAYYGDKYSMQCLAMYLFFVNLDWIVLASPDKERWHKIRYNKKPGGKVKKNNNTPQSFLWRLWWGLRLASTNRYTGWSQQVKNTPVEVPADYPRWLFILRKSLRVVFMYLLVDSLCSYTASTPHGGYRGHENGKVPVGFDDLSLRDRFAFTWVYILITYTSLELFNAMYGVLAVLCSLADPRDCPSAFGDLKEMYTIRKSWSVVWHQNCRRVCSAPGIFLARDVLHLRKGAFASRYLQLFIGFFTSAMVHGGAALLTHRSLDDAHSFGVFMAQPIAIFCEDYIIDFGRYIGLRDSILWRAVGFAWTVVWFGLSLTPHISAMVSHGMWLHQHTGNLLGFGPSI